MRGEDLRSLKSFRQEYPEADVMLLYRGAEQLRVDGISCLPVDEFLRALRPGRPIR